MTTSISSEAQNYEWISEKNAIKQFHTININVDKIGKLGNLKNHATLKSTKIYRTSTAIYRQILMKLVKNM